MLEERTKNKLIEKIKNDGGDEDFIYTLEKVQNQEIKGAEKSKKEYFRTEKLIIWISMFSSITAGISAIDVAQWSNSILNSAMPWINILSIVFPAMVTMLVAYRGVKKSYETWIRHRKYSMAVDLLINNYLYGSTEFDKLQGKDTYLQFRNEIQRLWKGSKDDFLNNMSKQE